MILIFGANGQVGSALTSLLGDKALAFNSAQADFSNPEQIELLLSSLKTIPDAIINAAAYTMVDKAEQEEPLALLVNATTPAVIARYAAKNAIPFIHYSTDYVFPGNSNEPLNEADSTSPQNAYGRTKLAGEEAIKAVGGKWLIFRTSWVYDEKGKNFLTTMLRLGKEREVLRVVNDQHGAPTYALDLAKATLSALENATKHPAFPSGIYHLSGSGATTWHGFAEAIFAEARKSDVPLAVQTLEGIPSSAYPTPAKRPENSQLDCSLAAKTLGVLMPNWQESLTHCMQHIRP